MCGCYEWESTGLPCVHAGMVILHMQLKIDDYCDEFYSVKKYMDIYKEMIQPLPDFTDLSYTHRTGMLQPPELKRRPGRSKKSRKIVFDEPPASEFRKRSSSVRCAICGKTCHNKRTYSRDPDTGKQRKQRDGHQGEDICSSQRMTRSQTSVTGIQDTIQQRTIARLSATYTRRKAVKAKAVFRCY
ncbi:uncharacterized protein LOC122071656 isoform X2 [Macadamia integrifolia]|uniref:uncharacterized protein LOC122071656 isoform X2 n=1 Tax=Macadamia integrifolia TaxID=60698 RepID=UPI001C4EEABC|nr:uncharacterized protein LOC122071656 isoform X2 [Macadamia integrifolia]